MTITLPRSGSRLKQSAQELTDDSLLRECAPLGFDRAKLAAAVRAFPVPRTLGQDTTSGTWGLVRHARGHLGESHSVLGGAGLGFREGRTFRLVLGPGVAVASSFDATRRERASERDHLQRATEVELVIRRPLLKPWRSDAGSPQTQITEWSRRSRARMVKGFASVDWSGLSRCYCGLPMTDVSHTYVAFKRCGISQAMPLAMVTLTYPGDWLAVAPDGKSAKRHLALFRQRWFRALGWRLDGAWKLEFQRARAFGNSEGQQAPHFHLLVPVPALVEGVNFNVWLSQTWADVVGALGDERARHEAAGTNVDFGRTSRMSDPKRCAIYFLKHGSKTLDDKEYQHTVPAAWALPGKGPGRFWGFWGMELATVALDLDLEDWVTARRVLRRVAAARARGVKYGRAKAAAVSCGRSAGEAVRYGVASAAGRKLRTLGVGGQLSGGWVVVNDGPALAGDLARAINLRRSLAGAIDDWPRRVQLP